MLETARSSTFLFLTGPFGVWRTHASGLPVQTEVYKTFMQIRLLLFLLCIFLMTPIDGYVKAGNGEDTLYYAGRTFSPNSSIGRNNHSLLFKTNAVAWGMAVMNVAVEYDISPAISVLIPFYYSPFNYFTSSRKLRTFCVQPEVRYWFGQVDGLFTGVHIGVASYNYALKNSTYRYQNSDTGTPLLNMGLTAGYRLSLGKGGCWCLEFSLGAGYAYLDYDRFFNIPGGAYVDTRHKNFFGIDHAGVSVGYRIDWKGGRR